MKECTRCQASKPEDDGNFPWNKTKGKFSSWCRPCTSAYNKAYRKANKSRLERMEKEHREANRGERNRKGREYKAENREAINEQAADYRERNRGALAEKSREYYAENSEEIYARSRASLLKHEYGLSPEQYLDMLEAQGGVCWICGGVPRQKSLHVDHDHKTGRLRGLLCMLCNNALGRFGDNVEGLRRIIYYMESAPDRMREIMPNGTEFEPKSKRHRPLEPSKEAAA